MSINYLYIQQQLIDMCIRILYFNNIQNTLFTCQFFIFFLFIYLNCIHSTCYISHGCCLVCRGCVSYTYLNLSKSLRETEISRETYMVWLLCVCSGNRSNSAPHLGYYAFEKRRKLSRAASIPLPAQTYFGLIRHAQQMT